MGMTKLGVRSSLLMSRIARAIKKIQEKKLRKGDLGPWLLVGFNDFNKEQRREVVGESREVSWFHKSHTAGYIYIHYSGAQTSAAGKMKEDEQTPLENAC